MKNTSRNELNRFRNKILGINKRRVKYEDILSSGLFARRDIHELYRALFLGLFISFEDFIDRLFMGLLVQKLDHPDRSVRPRIIVKSHKIAREMVLGPRKNYIDWMPYKNTKELAELFFTGGRPFSGLGRGEKDTISKLVIIRNAIAHDSHHARKKFIDGVLPSHLPPHQRNVPGFLRASFSRHPPVTYFEHYSVEITMVAKTLCGF